MIISGAPIRRFKITILLVVVLLVFGVTFGTNYFTKFNTPPKTAYAASSDCGYTGAWQNDPGYNGRQDASYVGIDSVQYFNSLTLTNTDFVFRTPAAKLVVQNGLTVDGASTIWGAWAFDESVNGNGPYGYVGDPVDIDIEVCGGSFDLRGKINNDGANNFRRSGDPTPNGTSQEGTLKRPKFRNFALESSEQTGDGGSGTTNQVGRIFSLSGSGGGGNGGGGGVGEYAFGAAGSGDPGFAAAGGGGGGVFANVGVANAPGGTIEDYVFTATIAQSLNYLATDQKDQSELYVTTFGGRGGIPLYFRITDSSGNCPVGDYCAYGWQSDTNRYYKSAGGGFVKIMIRGGDLNFATDALISSRGTAGQDSYIGGCHQLYQSEFNLSTGGGAGGTVYIGAKSVVGSDAGNSHITVAGGTGGTRSREDKDGAGCTLGASGGGGGGIIYYDVPGRSSVNANDNSINTSLKGGDADATLVNGSVYYSNGSRGRVVWGYLATASGGFAQVEKRTYSDPGYSKEAATFNSGDTVWVKLSITSPTGASGTTVTDEIPNGAVTTPDPPTGSTISGNTITWTNVNLGTSVTEIKYSFNMP